MILLAIFGIVASISIFYLVFFGRYVFSKEQPIQESHAYPVSVIICAKNEAENLRKNIPVWLAQDYPEFELILVNDRSVDESLEVMQEFAVKDARIQIVDVLNNEVFWGNKKYALTLGIKKAQHKRLLFTDADCVPASEFWIQQMTSPLNESTQIVLGYGGYASKPSLLNHLIRFETLATATQYFSYAFSGMPYMGVGRNLAYTANLFFEKKGFMTHMDLMSGDDDLFVNEAANAENVALMTTAESHTISNPKTKWRDWIRQKRRHYTTANRYQFKHKFLLSLYYFSNLLFWIMACFAWFPDNWLVWGSILGLRLLTFWIVMGKASLRFKEKGLLLWLPILDLFLVLFQISIFISGSLTKQGSWK